MTKAPLLGFLLVLSALTVACSDVEPEPTPVPDHYPPPASDVAVAGVRVVNAHAKASTFDVLVDNKLLLGDLSYRSASDYLRVEAGSRQLSFVTGSGSFDDYELDLAEGVNYTFLPCCVQFPGSTVLTDDNSEPAAGNAKVRVVEFATVASYVSVYLTAPGADLAAEDPTFVLNLGYGSDYIEVPAGDYQMRVTEGDSKAVVISSGRLSLGPGQVRTIVTVDAAAWGAPYDFLVLDDLN
jgi:hypothetical protein